MNNRQGLIARYVSQVFEISNPEKKCSLQEMSNHIFQTCYNLCRINKTRQEEAAQAGILPCLKRIIEISSPLKQFALPILCDLASAGKSCRTLLWQHDGLGMYLKLLEDPYFQVSALESILSWYVPGLLRFSSSSFPWVKVTRRDFES